MHRNNCCSPLLVLGLVVILNSIHKQCSTHQAGTSTKKSTSAGTQTALLPLLLLLPVVRRLLTWVALTVAIWLLRRVSSLVASVLLGWIALLAVLLRSARATSTEFTSKLTEQAFAFFFTSGQLPGAIRRLLLLAVRGLLLLAIGRLALTVRGCLLSTAVEVIVRTSARRPPRCSCFLFRLKLSRKLLVVAHAALAGLVIWVVVLPVATFLRSGHARRAAAVARRWP